MKKTEHGPALLEPEKEKSKNVKLLEEIYEQYRARPDEPKYSYKEQSELERKSSEASKMLREHPMNESLKKASDEAAKEFLESKKDKKHIGAVTAPLVFTKEFLESEEGASRIPEAPRKQLLGAIDNILNIDIPEAREKERISDELVAKILNTMDKLEENI